MQILLRNREVQSGILLLLVSSFFLVAGRKYEFGSFDMMGPGFVPLSLAGLLALLGLALVGVGVRSKIASPNSFATFAFLPTGMVLGAVALFAATLFVLGYFAACLLLVAIGGMAASDRRPVEVLIASVVISAVTGIIFIEVLGLPMPLLPEWL